MRKEETIGFGKPPTSSQFKEGKSGNPRGRPKNRHREIPYDAVLGQMVTIREEGRERRVTAAEALLLQLTKKGLAGDSAEARASLEAIGAARVARGDDADQIDVIVLRSVGNGANSILDDMGVTKLKFPTDKARVRRELSPWAEEAALDRLGDTVLTVAEKQLVWNATRSPTKAKWPAWWAVGGRA